MDDLDDDDLDEDDLDDEDEDDFEEEDEDEEGDDSSQDVLTLQRQCRECSPNYPEWLKRDVVKYINADKSDLNRLSEFLGIHMGDLVVWKRKFS